MNKFSVFVLFLFLILSKSADAQKGPQPSYMNWHSIENNAVRVIFPDSTSKEARRIADIIAHINIKSKTSVGPKSKKIDILLNTNTAQANGYVTLAPYHSQFYGTGPQNFSTMGALNWLDDLAVHEYRHSLQFCNANRGYTKLLQLINGEYGWRLGIGLAVPNWFFEGDAVLAETVLTPAGRGRTPSFFELQRALLLNGKNYSYMQARNGSFKNLMPNHYPLGYALVNYGRNHYGPELWPKVLADAGSYRDILYPFSRALRYHTGMTTSKLYQLAYKELKEQWERELDTLKLTPTQSISNVNPQVVTNYSFPHFLADGSILCLKSSYNETANLIKTKDGVETILTSVGIATEPFVGLGSNKATWTEMRKDSRRDAVEYSVIMSFDLASGQKKQITQKSKYFSPVFSSGGDQLVAVEANVYLKNSIKVLDAITGSVIHTIPNEQNDFLSYPKWTKNDASIIYLAKRNSKVCILKYDLVAKVTTELTDWTSNTIGAYTIDHNLVYFTASFSGINNIYVVGLHGDKQIRQLSSVRIGADMPAISNDGQSLALIEQTTMGTQLTSLPLNEGGILTSSPINITEPVDMTRYRVWTTQSEHNILDSIPQGEYLERKYNGLLPGVKLHSWSPVVLGWSMGFIPSRGDSRDIGFRLYMADILGNFSGDLAAKYNTNENTVRFGGGFTYSKYYLPITVRASSGSRTSKSLAADGKTSVDKTFTQTDIAAGVALPLSWVRGNYTTGIQWNTWVNNASISDYHFVGERENYTSMQVAATLYNIRRKGLQNTNNKWSQVLQLNYERSLTRERSADMVTLKTDITAVGLRKNHGLGFGFKLFKGQSSNNYLYEDSFEHARGYEPTARDLEYVFSVNYSLPLCYPDFGIGGILFFNQIRANLFYDIGMVYRNSNNTMLNQNSVGAEIIVDTKWLNIVPVSLGFRNSLLLNEASRGELFEFFVAKSF